MIAFLAEIAALYCADDRAKNPEEEFDLLSPSMWQWCDFCTGHVPAGRGALLLAGVDESGGRSWAFGHPRCAEQAA